MVERRFGKSEYGWTWGEGLGSELKMPEFCGRLLFVNGTEQELPFNQCFFVKEYFPVPSYPVAINVKTGMPPFGILANHKMKMCHNSMKKE